MRLSNHIDRLMAQQVVDCGDQKSWAVAEAADTVVAAVTEKATDLFSGMAVVDMKAVGFRIVAARHFPANRARAGLSRVHGLVLRLIDSVKFICIVPFSPSFAGWLGVMGINSATQARLTKKSVGDAGVEFRIGEDLLAIRTDAMVAWDAWRANAVVAKMALKLFGGSAYFTPAALDNLAASWWLLSLRTSNGVYKQVMSGEHLSAVPTATASPSIRRNANVTHSSAFGTLASTIKRLIAPDIDIDQDSASRSIFSRSGFSMRNIMVSVLGSGCFICHNESNTAKAARQVVNFKKGESYSRLAVA